MAEARANDGRHFSLALYVGIVFLLSWPFQFAIHFWASSTAQAIGLSAISMWMVGIATYLVDRIAFHQGFSSAGWGKGKAWHYVVVLLLALFLWPLPTAVEHYWGALPFPKTLAAGDFAAIFGLLVLVMLGAAFGEELGWRGYLLPRLAARTTARRAVLIQGLIWFCWHLPLVGTLILGGSIQVAAGTGLSRVLTIPAVSLIAAFAGTMHAVVLAYIWCRSGSLAVVTIYHAMYVSLRDSITVTIGLASLSGWWAIAVLSILGLFLIFRGNWQALGQLAEKQVNTTPQAIGHEHPETGE